MDVRSIRYRRQVCRFIHNFCWLQILTYVTWQWFCIVLRSSNLRDCYFLNLKDSIRYGDRDHDMIVWKYFLLLFKACGRKNYALTILVQYHITLPPRLAEQLKWSRFINMHDTSGYSISCDLHMEHLTKLIIEGLEANKSEKATTRVRKAISTMMGTLRQLWRCQKKSLLEAEFIPRILVRNTWIKLSRNW